MDFFEINEFKLKMSNLEICFNKAKWVGANYVAVLVEMEGFPHREIIINTIENADSKLEYYKKTYDIDLVHKHSNGIKIVGCTFGDSFEEIEEDLSWHMSEK